MAELSCFIIERSDKHTVFARLRSHFSFRISFFLHQKVEHNTGMKQASIHGWIKAAVYHALICGMLMLELSGFGQAQVSTEAKVFGPDVLSAGEVFRGSFTPDGRSFYFFKKVAPGEEEYRIFVSHLKNNQWSEPVRVDLGGDYSDTYPAISKDGKRMAFASYRPVPGVEQKKPNAHL